MILYRRGLFLEAFNGNTIAQNLSIPIAMFVDTLTVTETTCKNMTMGHIGSENTQFESSK
ncbi:hypothetical protein DPMN_191820 [Dreissena polymorpha]|uniref:Uncharacterized protein n=1 Tax=Dreissena polymorpha TaxID=45954 RepID=A0A9D3XY68_DREPO|nr:hypothetical protein DPMN_191820 [Dreissena polymorpha]